jgi:hypothetical protein
MPRYNGGFIGHDGLDAPDAPTIGTPSAGSTQADIAFTAGAAGTTATTEFVATTNDGIGATGTSSPITITGLTNNTSYTARVYAKNSHGTSAASAASASFTPLAEVISGLFSTHVYKGNNSTQTVTNNINLSGKGGLVWIKNRSTSSTNHSLFDTVSGATGGNRLRSNLTNGLHNFSGSAVFATSSTGFALNSTASQDLNDGSDEYVSWTFRKEPKFFDIVTYTGTGSAQAISHSLNSTVGMIAVKRTDTTGNWAVYHRGANGGTDPEDYHAGFNLTDEFANNAGYWNDTAPTTTQFTVGDDNNVNANSGTYVAYLFAHNNSDGGFGPDSEDIIKCGYYTGNGSSTGPSVTLGFEPQFVMIKNASSTQNWWVLDNMRGVVSGGADTRLKWNTSDSEDSTGDVISLTSTGFDVTTSSSSTNTNGDTYIYMAIRRGGMNTPSTPSDVFALGARGSSTPGFTSNFPVDMFIRSYTTTTGYPDIGSRLTGAKSMQTSDNFAEGNDSSSTFDHMTGYYTSSSADSNHLSWMWKRARGFFDVVTYNPTSTSNQTITHNLGVKPEMVWIKQREAISSTNRDWAVGAPDILGLNNNTLSLNNNYANGTLNYNMFTQQPTATQFVLHGNENGISSNGGKYIAYLFATVAGVSKVGSITGNGSTSGDNQNIDCGFTNGAKFVLIKRSSAVGGWYLFDTTQGIVSGNDPFIALNTSGAAQTTNVDLIDTLSSGFVFNYNSDWSFNLSGNTYLFYAIANDPS